MKKQITFNQLKRLVKESFATDVGPDMTLDEFCQHVIDSVKSETSEDEVEKSGPVYAFAMALCRAMRKDEDLYHIKEVIDEYWV